MMIMPVMVTPTVTLKITQFWVQTLDVQHPVKYLMQYVLHDTYENYLRLGWQAWSRYSICTSTCQVKLKPVPHCPTQWQDTSHDSRQMTWHVVSFHLAGRCGTGLRMSSFIAYSHCTEAVPAWGASRLPYCSANLFVIKFTQTTQQKSHSSPL